MSVNRNKPHILVLPEDDANHRIANGFQLSVDSRQIYVLPEAGGWIKVLEAFSGEHVNAMQRFPDRSILLLIDLDNDRGRLNHARTRIPGHLNHRVFILGALTEPEDLKNDLGSYERIGGNLARDCRDGTDETWSHRLLVHNAPEVLRLREHIRPILFA